MQLSAKKKWSGTFQSLLRTLIVLKIWAFVNMFLSPEPAEKIDSQIIREVLFVCLFLFLLGENEFRVMYLLDSRSTYLKVSML